jgi:hypothetical protein
VLEIDLCEQRAKLGELFELRFRQAPGLFRQFRQMLSSPLPTADVADLVAFNLFEDVGLKQSLLEEADVVKRVNRVIAELSSLEFVESSNAAVARVDDPSLN